MLKFKLFKSTALTVFVFGILAALLGMHMIQTRVVREAQDRVRLDLNSAWAVYNNKLQETKTILQLVAEKDALKEEVENIAGEKAQTSKSDSPNDTDESSQPAATVQWPALQHRLDKIRVKFDLDFLTVANHRGRVLMRTANPDRTGDFAPNKGAIMSALEGQAASETSLFSSDQLKREGRGLVEQAFLPLKETPKAKPTPRDVEERGMVMLAAVPLQQAGRIIGVVYGGILLNRNQGIVDKINAVVYEEEREKGTTLAVPGSVTIFLHDTRIATTVRTEQENRAYGTRVSTEVAETVLENNRNWIGRAFVVNDWYLTAYGPIQNFENEVIGMLYVGILEQPYRELGRNILWRYALLVGAGLLAALLVAFYMAGRLAKPLHHLSEAAHRMQRGEYPEDVAVEPHASRETIDLVEAFNSMATSLQTREAELRRANQELEKANNSLSILNRNYMETVEFVTHELKRPVASMVNYVYMLDQQLLGELNEKQQKAVGSLHRNLKSFSEMIRHYLNLARIENDELSPSFSATNIKQDVVDEAVNDIQSEAEQKSMTIDNAIPDNIVIHADVNMLREVFDNLLSNAVKYGREGGQIRVNGQNKGEGKAEFAVWNEGPGIAGDKLPNLFQKFSRLEDQDQQKQKGTGLGLFISKQIIEAHKGSINADSEPGKWAEFRFVLPLDPEQDSLTKEKGDNET